MSAYKRKDHYYRKARGKGYLSRAAFKLEQINSSSRVIKKGDAVVDIGCAPGGWSQVALNIVGTRGIVIGIDVLKECRIERKNFIFINRDVRDGKCPDEVVSRIGRKSDVVISDAAPNTTGITFTDQARSADLVRDVLGFATRVLRRGGNILVKVFDGPETRDLVNEMRVLFNRVERVRPPATRKESFEIYLVGMGFAPGSGNGGD